MTAATTAVAARSRTGRRQKHRRRLLRRPGQRRLRGDGSSTIACLLLLSARRGRGGCEGESVAPGAAEPPPSSGRQTSRNPTTTPEEKRIRDRPLGIVDRPARLGQCPQTGPSAASRLSERRRLWVSPAESATAAIGERIRAAGGYRKARRGGENGENLAPLSGWQGRGKEGGGGGCQEGPRIGARA